MSAFLKGKTKTSKFLLPFLFGLLAIGLIGFGTGTPQGSRVGAMGTVGETDIEISVYVQNLQNSMEAVARQIGRQPNAQEVQIFGLTNSALETAVSTAALDNEITRLNLAATDERLAQEIRNLPSLQSLDGTFDAANYERTLRLNGLTVEEFEAQIRNSIIRGILETSVVGAVQNPSAYAETLLSYVLEERGVEYTILSADQLATRAGEPTEAELTAFYEENAENYETETTRNLSYIVLNQSDVIGNITIEEQTLLDAYTSNPDRFNRPAMRIVDRLVFADEDAANQAKARIDALTTTYDQIVEERGLALADVDLGEVIEGQLDAEADAAIFGSDNLGIFGPLPTTLGPALFRVNAVIAAETIEFENARPDLLAEAEDLAATREIQALYGDIDDLLASGATLEEVAEETPMRFETYALTAISEDGIAAYEEFREAGNAVSESDFPELLELSDGGLFALRLDEIVEPQQQPLSDIRPLVVTDWQAAEDQKLLAEEADRIKSVIETGTSFSSLSLSASVIDNLQRTSFDTPIPLDLVEQLFELNEGQAAHIASDDVRILARLNTIRPYDPESETGADARDRVNQQINVQFSGDLLAQYVTYLRNRDGVSVNQLILDQVNAQILTGGHGG